MAGGLSLLVSSIVLADEENEYNLIEYMASFQYFGHKTYFSIQHKNKPLAEFYLHELEEVLEKVEEVDDFKGYKVGDMSKNLLEPAFKAVDQAVDDGKWELASENFSKMIDACNTCHESVQRGYLHIKLPESNPYMQSFEAKK